MEFDNLHTYFFTDTGVVKSVDGVTFEVPIGKTVGVVGESGCGKSVTSLSLMQLLQRPQGQVVDGAIRLNLGDKAYDVTKVPDEQMQHLRGNFVSMIFQEPMTSLNPVFRIGDQVDEVIALHEGEGKSKEDIKARTIELLEMVGIANSEGVYKMFPHELSGGMRQRVMIAMALACSPQAHYRGRAHHRAGRDHSGADPGSAAEAEGQDQFLHHVHHPRSGRHRRDGGLCGGHVRRPHRGEGHRRRDLRSIPPIPTPSA